MYWSMFEKGGGGGYSKRIWQSKKEKKKKEERERNTINNDFLSQLAPLRFCVGQKSVFLKMIAILRPSQLAWVQSVPL